MKIYYSIYHSKRFNDNSYSIYKEYEYGTNEEDFLYSCNNLSEMKIYLNLLRLNWEDFKLYNTVIINETNIMRYDTNCME